MRAAAPPAGAAQGGDQAHDSFSGEGNAIFRYPGGDGGAASGSGCSPAAVRDALAGIELAAKDETLESYFAKFDAMGGVVEEFIEGKEKVSPSTQLRISPHWREAQTSPAAPDNWQPVCLPTSRA